MAVCITCFLQETKSCATLKCMHLIKELNARNLILQTPVMLSDDYMWSKNVWIYQIQSTPTLILMNSFPKTINSLSPLWSDFRGPIYQHRPNLYICCKISRSMIITRKIRLLRVCSEWLNILITSYSKEAINTDTFKHVF